MKKLFFVAALFAATTAHGQSQVPNSLDDIPMGEANEVGAPQPEDFVGVWKVKAKCTEAFCDDKRDNEPAVSSLTAQTWNISYNGGRFTLASDNKSIPTITDGYIKGKNLIFRRSTSTSNPVKIVLRLESGRLKGLRVAGRQSGAGFCQWRFNIDGAQ